MSPNKFPSLYCLISSNLILTSNSHSPFLSLLTCIPDLFLFLLHFVFPMHTRLLPIFYFPSDRKIRGLQSYKVRVLSPNSSNSRLTPIYCIILCKFTPWSVLAF